MSRSDESAYFGMAAMFAFGPAVGRDVPSGGDSGGDTRRGSTDIFVPDRPATALDE